MEQIECSETSAYKIQTPRNYPEENIQHTEYSESLKSRVNTVQRTCTAIIKAGPESHRMSVHMHE
jgi:hypothetical protein